VKKGTEEMTLDEYSARMAEELENLDWRDPRNKESSAYRLLSDAARDRALPTRDWQKLFDQYQEGVRKR